RQPPAGTPAAQREEPAGQSGGTCLRLRGRRRQRHSRAGRERRAGDGGIPRRGPGQLPGAAAGGRRHQPAEPGRRWSFRRPRGAAMSTRRDLARNRRLLGQALDAFAAYLSRTLAGEPTPLGTYLECPPALAGLAERLGLNRFEQDLLLLAVAVELDVRFRQLLAEAQGDPHRPWPSFDLALSLLALAGSGGPLQARLVVDERILHQVIGLSYPDPRLEPWFRPLEAATVVAVDEDVRALAEQWQGAADLARAPLARLEQGDGEAF